MVSRYIYNVNVAYMRPKFFPFENRKSKHSYHGEREQKAGCTIKARYQSRALIFGANWAGKGSKGRSVGIQGNPTDTVLIFTSFSASKQLTIILTIMFIVFDDDDDGQDGRG